MSDRLRPGNVSQVGTYFNCHIYDKAPLCIIANKSPRKMKELRANLARSSGKHDDPVNFAPSWREVNDHIYHIMYILLHGQIEGIIVETMRKASHIISSKSVA